MQTFVRCATLAISTVAKRPFGFLRQFGVALFFPWFGETMDLIKEINEKYQALEAEIDKKLEKV